MAATRMADVFDLPADAGFYDLAPVYDFVYRRAFDYGSQAERVREAATGEGVLELACGTGALAERLAGDHGYVGVDASASMLAVARRRVEAPFVRADARRVAFGRRFGAVAMLGLSASHFGADDLAAIARVALEHLDVGAFVLDAHDRAGFVDGYTSEEEYRDDRWTVVYRGRSEGTGEGWAVHEYGYDVCDRRAGETRTFEGTYRMRFWGASELETLLREAGFGSVDVVADAGGVRARASPT